MNVIRCTCSHCKGEFYASRKLPIVCPFCRSISTDFDTVEYKAEKERKESEIAKDKFKNLKYLDYLMSYLHADATKKSFKELKEENKVEMALSSCGEVIINDVFSGIRSLQHKLDLKIERKMEDKIEKLARFIEVYDS